MALHRGFLYSKPIIRLRDSTRENMMIITTSDVSHHEYIVGIDVYEPIILSENRTRLNMFYEEVRAQNQDLFQRVVSSDNEFIVSRRFSKPGGPNVEVRTFQMVPRGPVFSIPLRLSDFGATEFETNYDAKLVALQKLFFQAFPDRKKLKYGIIRHLIFATGNEPSTEVLAAPQDFCGATLQAGSRVAQYVDQECNVSISLQPVRANRVTKLGVGAQINQETGYGLQVKLDVNSKEIRPLGATDIERVRERAESLWPDGVLKFICGKEKP